MAEGRQYLLPNQRPDISQILSEAQHRWLRPAEICEILSNYKMFHIAPEPPNRPPSGSLYLFDRKVLRYFRKDGHNWRKKKDGKTVKEAHEKLKAGSVDVLHCYYAHGEENEYFQRRTYWMLEEAFMHIVLVHYLEVKSGKHSYNRTKEVEETMQLSNVSSPACSNSFTSQSQVAPQIMDTESPNSGQLSEFEDAESDNWRASSRYYPVFEMQQHVDGLMTDPLINPSVLVSSVNNQSYRGDVIPTTSNSSDFSSAHHDLTRGLDESDIGLAFSSKSSFVPGTLEDLLGHCSDGFSEPMLRSAVASMQASDLTDNSRFETFTSEALYTNNLSPNDAEAIGADGISLSEVASSVLGSFLMTSNDLDGSKLTADDVDYARIKKEPSLDLFKMEQDGLKKYDSFSRWMIKELGEVDDLQVKPNADEFWSNVESAGVVDDSSLPGNEQLDGYVLSPSLSQNQFFSIIGFSPSWAYAGSETKVVITGTFLTNKEHVETCKWSCMFGDVEVPAEVLTDGSLRCHAPAHKTGRVPLYVTCSNRLACSEVREFEYRETDAQYMETPDSCSGGINEMHLRIRLEKLLFLGPDDHQRLLFSCGNEKAELSQSITSLLMDDKFSHLGKPIDEKVLSGDIVRDQHVNKVMKEKLHAWLLCKINDDGKGPNVLGKEGQGVIHLAAALGYDWAIRPTIAAGVNVNFRDVHGWTALHWAASCGRERTVGTLIAEGAAPGLVTDPTLEYPSGRTPAELASANGYKGIAGFLAESSLTSHLLALTLKESADGDVERLFELPNDFAETRGALRNEEDSQVGSLKDSLSAVRKSTQAAARIYQAFRVESFHRRKVVEYGDADCGLSDERTLSLVSLQNSRHGQHDVPLHSAAVRIQNKFRGWKGRKEFLLIRQRIVKIQAHFRGHQVRKNYRKVVWSVGIVEKVILRWRRKRRGLRGFQPEGQLTGPSSQNQPAKEEDDYDFLRKGRKQAEARLQGELSRVKSMHQYPEAREQYRRLTNFVTEVQESKAMQDNLLKNSEQAYDDFMDGVEGLSGDDASLTPLW